MNQRTGETTNMHSAGTPQAGGGKGPECMIGDSGPILQMQGVTTIVIVRPGQASSLCKDATTQPCKLIVFRADQAFSVQCCTDDEVTQVRADLKQTTFIELGTVPLHIADAIACPPPTSLAMSAT